VFASIAAALLVCGHATAAGFLSTGPGARAAAMGGAFTGLADDSSAIFYNPAGLAGQRGALMLEHVPINESGTGFAFNDGRLDFLGLNYPSRYGSFGFGFYQFSIGGIEGRTNLSDAATTLSASQTAYFVPYAFKYNDWAFGATGKAVTYSLAGYGATGFGADIGAKTSLFRGDTFLGRETNITMGAAVRNILAPTLTLYEDPTALERTTTIGIAMTSFVSEHYETAADHVSHDRFTMTMDATLGNQDSGFTMAMGLEYAYQNLYALRGGFNSDRNVTIGVGAGGPDSPFRFDYAAVLAPLAPQHRFTISWLFTEPRTSIESDVHLPAYRRAVLDQQRSRERFIREGNAAATEGRYDTALSAFLKAQALDPHDDTINGLVQSGQEGNRLAGVKELLDSARREHGVKNDDLASKDVLQAIILDPDNREVVDYSVRLRNEMIAAGSPAAFDMARAQKVESLTHDYDAAAAARNIYGVRRAAARVKAIDPDDTAAWQLLDDKLTSATSTWLAEYLIQANAAFTAHDAVAMARAVRRIRRLDPHFKDLGALSSKVRKLSRKIGSSFYDTNYLRQLYDTAAFDYVLANYQSAAENLAVLIRSNATHEDGNALIDRMRDEGCITEEQEP
jgi:tetratricopeptide (TPR) repeat protein